MGTGGAGVSEGGVGRGERRTLVLDDELGYSESGVGGHLHGTEVTSGESELA